MRLILTLLLLFSACFFVIAQVDEEVLKPQLRIDPQGHSGVVNALQFTPDGKTLISVSADKTIRFWDIESGMLNKTIRTQSDIGPKGAIYTAGLSPDGQYLALGGYFAENEIRLINLKRKQDVVLLKGHKNVITKLVFSKSGRLIASASADKTIKVWKLTYNEGEIQGELIKTLTGHEASIYDLDFSPDGTSLVSASADGSLRLWNLEGSTTPVLMRMHVDKVYSCTFSTDGSYIVSGGNKGKIIAWNSNGTFRSMVGDMESSIAQLNFSSDNKLFASAKAVNIYTIPTTLVGVIPKQGRNITAAAIYEDKYFATSASTTGDIIIRNIQDQSIVSTVGGSGLVATQVASNNNGVIAVGSKPRTLSVAFDLKALKFLFNNFDKQTFTGEITAEGGYSLNKLDQYTLSTGFKGSIKNNPAIDGRILKFTIIDANRIAVGSDFSIKIYSRDGVLQKTLTGANGAVTSLAVDHQLNYLITGTTDETVRVWDIDNGNLIASLFFSKYNDWICWTSTGYYQASAGGEKFLGWQINRGSDKFSDFYPASVFAKNFHQPEVVKQTILLGNEAEALAYLDKQEEKIVKKDINIASAAPKVEWISPELIESDAGKSRIMIKANIISSSPIKTVKILINGRPAPQSRGINNQAENDMMVEQEILLLNEINKIKIFVSNENAKTVSEERIINLPKEIAASKKGSNTQVIDFTAKPDLFILGIGVSEYANSDYNLTYADDDATSITELFSTIGKGTYKKIHLEQVTNQEATKKKILNSFAWLYQNATSKDIVVIFIASHGFNEDGEFYILPHDGDANRLAETGIGWNDLSNTLGKLPSKVLLMVDACYSGQLGTNIEHIESDNTEAVREISGDEFGVVVMAASTGNETSQEFESWGHGAFTLSVLEGLEQGKADIKSDMTIFLRELDFYVSERTIELTNGQQHPTTQKPSSVGRFPVITIDK